MCNQYLTLIFRYFPIKCNRNIYNEYDIAGIQYKDAIPLYGTNKMFFTFKLFDQISKHVYTCVDDSGFVFFYIKTIGIG